MEAEGLNDAETSEGDHNVADLHERIAREVPDRDAIVDGREHFSWAALTDRTRRLAAVLRSAGIGLRCDPSQVGPWESPHDHVALYLYNGHEYLEGMLGAWKVRAAAININYRYVAGELAYVLRDSRAKALIVDSSFVSTVAEVLEDLPDLDLVLVVDGKPSAEITDQTIDAIEAPLRKAKRYEEALAAATPFIPEALTADDRYILYTGGTTGRPKGVLWRQGDFLATCLGVAGDANSLVGAAAASSRADLRTLPCAPLMHGAAHWNAISAFTSGGTVVIPENTRRLDPADVLTTCERERVTALQIVGDAFARPLLDELRSTTYDVSALRFLLSGGALFSAPLKEGWTKAVPGLQIKDVLGSSETGRQAVGGSGAASFDPGDNAAVLSGDRTRRLEPGEDEVGWLAQRGRVPLGYLGDPDKTRATFPVIDGARHAVAGDRVRLRANGRIDLLGRDAAVINTGGEKVYAEEVELALTSHPAVADALVVGREDRRWGQAIVAVVQPVRDTDQEQAGQRPTDDELRTHCRASLAGYKLPKAVIWVDEVRRSPSGKPDYAWAKQIASASMGRPTAQAQEPPGA